MNLGGYSAASRERAKEQVEELKDKSRHDVLIRKQKIKHLSTQTNRLRKKHEQTKKEQENEDEKRRLRILRMRKIKQDAATEKFQRTPDKKRRDDHSSDKKTTGLKDGNYSVGGHVIEIRNGKRISSVNDRIENQNHNVFKNSKFQNSLYDPATYLNNHLNNLFNDNSSNSTITDRHHAPLTLGTEDDLRHPTNIHEEQSQEQIIQTPKSPTDSLCSNDSLSADPPYSEAKLLRSSLKGSNLKMNDSLTRKVTFSDSVEFNDGDTRPIFMATAMAKIPLYKRIEQKQLGVNKGSHSINSKTQQQNNNSNVNIPSTEQLLDQLRQEAFLPKYPRNEDFSYPYSVVVSQQSNIAIVSPMGIEKELDIKPIQNLKKDSTDSLSADSLSIASLDDSIDTIDIEPSPVTTLSITSNETVASASTTQTTTYVSPSHSTVIYYPNKQTSVPSNPTPTPVFSNENCRVSRTFENDYNHRYPLSTANVDENVKFFNRESKNIVDDDVYTNLHEVPSDVVKIHADTVNPYLSRIVKNDNIDDAKEKEFEPDVETLYYEPTAFSKSNKIEDTVYKDIEASLASVTFETVSSKISTNSESTIIRPTNHPQCQLDVDYEQAAPIESERIVSAVKEDTSIPVRIHSGNARRGRIIVSANEKKRRQQIGSFTPHPPPKAKYNENNNNTFTTNKQQHDVTSPRTLPPKSKPMPKNKSNNTSSKNKPSFRKQTVQAYSPRQKPINKVNSKPSSPRVKLHTNNHKYSAPSPRVQSVAFTPQHQPPQIEPAIYDRMDNPKNKTNVALDKTPTDEEINQLWRNVRNCLSSEVPDQAYSDTACHIEPRKYHQRTLSGSLIRRSNNDQVVYKHLDHNKRYSSYESLNRPNSNDSFSSNASSFTRRQALLPQRSSRVLSPKMSTDNNNNNNGTYFSRKTINSQNKNRQNHAEVSESMAAFLALEELCNEQSLTPTQTEAVFNASKSLMRKQKFEMDKQKGMSALSIEEHRVMESLDRINEKLKRQEQIQSAISRK